MKIKDWEMKTYESRIIIKKWQGCQADGCHGTWRKMR